MACIKGVNRSASVALAPDAPYLAAGTMAGAVDLSFSSSASLEIFKLDFQSDDRELPVVGESPSSERFNRLSWARPTDPASEKFGLGLIAGGLVDGSIDIWNPISLIRSEASESALVGHLSRHKGPVRGLEFNVIAPNLLASGADDGEICIWDLANPAEPSQFPPLKGSGSAAQGEISFLSWNSKVQLIFASTSYNGTTVVWDLRKQKPVISFSDSVRRRSSVLQWHPDIATQLVVASDEDGSPALRLWDMRNIMSPVKEFVGHTKGVIAMSWCPNYSSYLLTCAKDNRTICWDTTSAEIVCELPASTNWNFDVHWYPKIPGVISASSFDGKIGIYNIEGCSRYGAGEADFGAAHLRAPKWYKRPVGVSFGFGGKLVSFHPKSSVGGASTGSEVLVHSLVTEQSLVTRSSEFEAAIQNGERSLLRTLCDKKLQDSESEDERETWGLLKVMFEDDGTARTKLLTHLGFSLPEVEKTDVQDDLSKELNSLGLEHSTVDNVGFGEHKEAIIFPSDNGEDFFNNLPSPKADTPLSTSGDKFIVGDAFPGKDQVQQELDGLEESTDPSFDEYVQHALVVGDYKGAVAKCISANKLADALVIAHAGGETLWESTRDQYLKMSRSPYLKVASPMVNNDLLSLVNTRPLKFWKETLALLCSFASIEQWTLLCDALASKLIAAGNTLAATICYICAGNIDKTVEIWSRSLATEHEGKSYVDRLQDLMEKTIVFALASGQKQFSASLCKLVERYAEILASQGLLQTAMEYLKLFGSDEVTPELQILKDRIALCTESEKVVEPSAPSGPVYGSHDRNYDIPPSPYQPNPINPYVSNNGPPYVPPYVPPVPQPAPQPHVFVPQQSTPHVPKDNYFTPPASHQPSLKTFTPSTPPALKNVDQYQQPSSLASQLYPGTNNTAYQSVPSVPLPSQPTPAFGHNVPFGVPPYVQPKEFTPVPNPGVVQGPGSIQPPSPSHAAPVQPVVTAPPPPPPTVQTADTSNVPAHQKPVILTLTRLFNETSEAMGGLRANPSRRREIEDNSRKLGALFAKLNSRDISKNAADKLVQLCQALDNGDFSTALQIQVLLTTSEWDECNFWLATLKRMIKTRQNVRLS
ncbi:protein transport protein SEC31 homolog B [Morus notabilis]|uniref:protein transport protein SEC31 homolog B n=1 Tax=Morus notabilis TaxID=981085 RepID=UPI000CED0A77|nr:protein transport protein SEC31 homolog B [Morus notabilis]